MEGGAAGPGRPDGGRAAGRAAAVRGRGPTAPSRPDQRTAFAAAVVYDRVERRMVEVVHRRPNRSGRRTCPASSASARARPCWPACGSADKHDYGVVCFDGQGYAHPAAVRPGRRTWPSRWACPGSGVAKSRFVGTHAEPARRRRVSHVPLMDKQRTHRRRASAPAPASTRCSSASATASTCRRPIALVLDCCKVRVPEPTRQADAEVARLKTRMNHGDAGARRRCRTDRDANGLDANSERSVSTAGSFLLRAAVSRWSPTLRTLRLPCR